MGTYLINGNNIDKSNSDFEDVLFLAHKNKVRPLCLCQNPGVSMYIANIGDNYIIKRMPNTGHLHHTDCESFEFPAGLSGRGDVENKAIKEDSITGITSLKFDFSLSKISRKQAEAVAKGKEQSSIKNNPTKLSIRSLLHYLYEEAGLNKWSPKMKNKRNWFVIRKYLLQAAQHKSVKNNKLSTLLLIPEVFKVEQKDTISVHRKQFLSKLKNNQAGIIIGEVKNIQPSRFGHKMLIKHMPDMPVYMEKNVYDRIQKNFAVEFSVFEEYEETHLLSICAFFVTASGNVMIDTVSFMVVDQNWIPFESIEEKELISRLVNAERFFIKGLRYNLTSSDAMACMLITDTKEGPTALYMIPADSDDQFQKDLGLVMEESDLRHYMWDLNDEKTFKLPL